MKLPKAPALRFLPLLVLYLLIVGVNPGTALLSDSARYIWFAKNLAHGYYSPQPDINLWNGPGYPLVLWPFAAVGLPWVWAKVANCFFMFGALLYFHALVRRYTSSRAALAGGYVLGLWPPILRIVPALLTEVLAILLVCGFAFHFCKIGRPGRVRWLHLGLAAAYMAYLALTRVFYGYVMLACLIAFAGIYVWRRAVRRRGALVARWAAVFGLGLLLCAPYLVYTHSLTGKPFYWATSGGLSLYWMASPYESDLGDWYLPGAIKGVPELSKNHSEFFAEIGHLSAVEQDDALKKRALENIAAHPEKFLKNWLANIGRLLFNYPYSYKPLRASTYLYMVPGILLVAVSLLCIPWTLRKRGRVPAEIWALLLVAAVAFGGNTLLSAFNRFLLPILPIVLLWICFVVTRLRRVETAC
jgi:hypothetical protein